MGKSDKKNKTAKAARKGVSNGRRLATNGHGTGIAVLKAKKPLAKATAKRRSRRTAIVLPEGYRPSDSEPFMNERQRVYFRNKLVAWKEEIVRANRETLHILH
jgi:DnaK suppressor protein